MSGERRRPDAEDMAPREAVQRYLRRRRADAAERSIETWHYRLKSFVEWCESVGIHRIGDLRSYDFDEYYEIRSAEIAPATLEGEMWTVKMFARYLDQLNVSEDGLADSVRIPDLDEEDRTDDTKLATSAALMLIDEFRANPEWFGSRTHVLIELAWMTGARQGGLRALDLRDAHLEKRYVEFFHRPETGTPLKNKLDGERPVGIPEKTARALRRYVEHRRDDVHDDHGRQPLFSSQRGRPNRNTIRVWCYLGTQPCIHSACPHGRERDSCEWVHRSHASKCPSSRSPHPIRTGSITFQLNRGIPPEVVAERVNASIKTIKKHYDKASREERLQRRRDRMERDRRHFVNQLDHEQDLAEDIGDRDPFEDNHDTN